MAKQTKMLRYIEAQNEALKEEMRRDKRVVLWGEDLVSMAGIFGTTFGIYDEFGPDRIRDTAIAETAIVEMAVGAALTGLRPVAFVMYASFVFTCFDGVFSKLGSMAQEFGYRDPVPVVIHAMISAESGFGTDHCMSPEALLIHAPDLKVVVPSTPYDAKGLLKAAIRDDGPVIYMPHVRLLFGEAQPVPTEDYVIPLGKADVKRKGNDITIVAYSAMVMKALAAAEVLSKEGISVEVVDLRTLVPLDVETVVQSVSKTGRLLIAHEAMRRGGAAGEIAFRVIEEAPDVVKTMKAPIKRLAAKNVALPHGIELEGKLVPQAEDVVKAVMEMM